MRTPEEYADGHRPGFRSAPGGQLVQETDWFATVDEAAEPGAWVPARPPAPEVSSVGPDEVDEWLRAGTAQVIDIDSSPRYRAGHLPGASWALRPDLARITGTAWGHRRIVLTSADGYLAAWAAHDLNAGGLGADGLGAAVSVPAAVSVLAGGTDGWARSGRPLESGDGELLSPPVDVYRRPYEGTGVDPALMQAYLDWEYGLVSQLERDGTHGFRVLGGVG